MSIDNVSRSLIVLKWDKKTGPPVYSLRLVRIDEETFIQGHKRVFDIGHHHHLRLLKTGLRGVDLVLAECKGPAKE